MNNTRTVLNGHTSPETAHVVDDYPYGFRLRCKIRYWLEFHPKRGYRFVSQTTNPKIAGREVWNKPKASTYSHGPAVMYLNDQGHVTWAGVHLYSSPEQYDTFRKLFGAQLDEHCAKVFQLSEQVSRKTNPQSWAEWSAKQLAA